MIATTFDAVAVDGYCDDADQFERFTYRRRGEFPVRAHTARSRAKMRSRATYAARSKARSFNGVNRRGRGKQWSTLA